MNGVSYRRLAEGIFNSVVVTPGGNNTHSTFSARTGDFKTVSFACDSTAHVDLIFRGGVTTHKRG